MSAYKDALAGLTAAAFDHFGEAAVYTPAGGGAAVACRVIVRATDVLAGIDTLRTVAADATVEVAVAEVAEAPGIDDLFAVVDGDTWRVVDAARRREDDRSVWTVDVTRETP